MWHSPPTQKLPELTNTHDTHDSVHTMSNFDMRQASMLYALAYSIYSIRCVYIVTRFCAIACVSPNCLVVAKKELNTEFYAVNIFNNNQV